MLALALLVVAASATTAAALLLRRRRARRTLAPRLDPLPAGRRLLVSGVSELSDLGLHLHAVRRMGKPRLGAVLGER